MKDKVPAGKVTSSKDVLVAIHMMMKQASNQESPYYRSAKTSSPASDHLNEEKTSPKTNENPSDDVELLKAEADKQMKAFLEEVDEGTLPIIDSLTSEEELALYISGIRLVNGLPLIIPEAIEEKNEVLSVLETSIQEYSIRKKVDTVMRLQRNLDRTSSKQPVKREEDKGIHELIDRSKRKMEIFSKEVVSEKGKDLGGN